jgi:hypothetical protein
VPVKQLAPVIQCLHPLGVRQVAHDRPNAPPSLPVWAKNYLVGTSTFIWRDGSGQG